MEYFEYCEGRWISFLGGLFWCPLIPLAYVLGFDQITEQGIGTMIFVTAAMALLMFAALVFVVNGVRWLIANGKLHLVLSEDYLQIIVNSGKHKGTVHEIKYADIKEFYFISKGAYNNITAKYYLSGKGCGTINFNVGDQFYCASVYNAISAAKMIMDKLNDSQIDKSKNELDREGSFTPKD